MVEDFRADPMPSVEGEGNAKGRWQRAWDAYVKAVEPAVEPAGRWFATRITEDMVGFWLMWHLEGGFEGLQRLGMSRSAIYRRIARFRKVFGAHPDVFSFPGVSIDLDEYLSKTSKAGPEDS